MEIDKLKQRARNNAYMLLRIRPRSEYEIRDRLRSKRYSADLIEGIVEELKKRGDIDDVKFASLWIESRMRLNPAGDTVLKYELKRKGIEPGTIEAALKRKSEDYDEFAIALPMAEDRFRRFGKIDRQKALKRVYDFMLRRGFKYDTVQRILEEIGKIKY